MFGEHGKWTHGNCLYEDVLRIPLLMRYPRGGARVAGLWMPRAKVWTDAVLLGLGGSRHAGLDGVSLRPLAEGRGAPGQGCIR